MSARTYVTLFCDTCGAWDDQHVNKSSVEARDKAKRIGWTVRNFPPRSRVVGHDLCPRCAEDIGTHAAQAAPSSALLSDVNTEKP